MTKPSKNQCRRRWPKSENFTLQPKNTKKSNQKHHFQARTPRIKIKTIIKKALKKLKKRILTNKARVKINTLTGEPPDGAANFSGALVTVQIHLQYHHHLLNRSGAGRLLRLPPASVLLVAEQEHARDAADLALDQLHSASTAAAAHLIRRQERIKNRNWKKLNKISEQSRRFYPTNAVPLPTSTKPNPLPTTKSEEVAATSRGTKVSKQGANWEPR